MRELAEELSIEVDNIEFIEKLMALNKVPSVS
jgi:hypothetical protein